MSACFRHVFYVSLVNLMGCVPSDYHNIASSADTRQLEAPAILPLSQILPKSQSELDEVEPPEPSLDARADRLNAQASRLSQTAQGATSDVSDLETRIALLRSRAETLRARD